MEVQRTIAGTGPGKVCVLLRIRVLGGTRQCANGPIGLQKPVCADRHRNGGGPETRFLMGYCSREPEPLGLAFPRNCCAMARSCMTHWGARLLFAILEWIVREGFHVWQPVARTASYHHVLLRSCASWSAYKAPQHSGPES